MIKCKICEKILKKSLAKHVRIHNISSIEYYDKYENPNYIISSYLSGKSADQIATHISDSCAGISPLKKDILFFLRNNNVKIRSTADAMQAWADNRDGPWTKGLTKSDHESIMKYSLSRMGENNPIHKVDKNKIFHWMFTFCEEDKIKICNKISNTLKEKYQSGEIIHYSKLDPEWATENQKLRMEGFRKWLEGGNRKNFFESKNEIKIASFLVEKDIKFIKHYMIGQYEFDYYLPDLDMLLEYNGTYWHCDPRKYGGDYYHTRRQKTAKEIWEYEEKRRSFALQKHKFMIVISELDVKTKTDEQFKEIVYECIKDKVDSSAKER